MTAAIPATLWRQPGALVAYFLLIDVVTLVLTAAFLVGDRPDSRQWWIFVVLAAMAVVQAEASRKIERARRLITNAPHVNMTSVWVFAGVVALPPSLTGLLVIVVYAHLWLRIWRRMGTRPVHRVLFSTAIIMLSAYAAVGVIAAGEALRVAQRWAMLPSGAVAAAAGALVFLLVNNILVTLAAVLHGRTSQLAISWADYALEIATLCLGLLAALVLYLSPVLVVLVLPPLLVLHRAVLVNQLEELAITDQKTGLLNATAWHEAAKAELARAERRQSSFGVLMVDLDHFKLVNDEYGHLAGDEVLKAVAELLKDEISEYDAAGRFGGEEFAVLIPDSAVHEVVATADRLRRRMTELEIAAPTGSGTAVIGGLTASIGVAVYPGSGSTVERLMLTVDSALYTAKSNGRNQVVKLP